MDSPSLTYVSIPAAEFVSKSLSNTIDFGGNSSTASDAPNSKALRRFAQRRSIVDKAEIVVDECVVTTLGVVCAPLRDPPRHGDVLRLHFAADNSILIPFDAPDHV